MGVAPFPAPINNWHNDTYAAISPTQPSVSAKGKKVIVTGGGAGIGRGTAIAFAQAGAASIVITGRRLGPLTETKKHIESTYNVSVSTFTADVTNEAGMKAVAASVGGWDVLVNNAGYMSKPGTALDIDINDWWKAFEINIKGAMIVTRAFFPTKNADAVFIGTATMAVSLPTPMVVTGSSYVASKLGLIKFLEVLAAENPDVNIMILHPGVVDTDMMDKSEMRGKLPIDTIELPSHFTVWLASEEARFLKGRQISCNWDIEELKAVKDKFEGSQIFRSGLQGANGPGFNF